MKDKIIETRDLIVMSFFRQRFFLQFPKNCYAKKAEKNFKQQTLNLNCLFCYQIFANLWELNFATLANLVKFVCFLSGSEIIPSHWTH